MRGRSDSVDPSERAGMHDVRWQGCENSWRRWIDRGMYGLSASVVVHREDGQSVRSREGRMPRGRPRNAALRAAGLRPVRICVPDTSLSGFAAECAGQAAVVAEADRQDRDLTGFLEDALEQVTWSPSR